MSDKLDKQKQEIVDETLTEIRGILDRDADEVAEGEEGLDDRERLAFRMAQVAYRCAMVSSLVDPDCPPPFVTLSHWAEVAMSAQLDSMLERLPADHPIVAMLGPLH